MSCRPPYMSTHVISKMTVMFFARKNITLWSPCEIKVEEETNFAPGEKKKLLLIQGHSMYVQFFFTVTNGRLWATISTSGAINLQLSVVGVVLLSGVKTGRRKEFQGERVEKKLTYIFSPLFLRCLAKGVIVLKNTLTHSMSCVGRSCLNYQNSVHY